MIRASIEEMKAIANEIWQSQMFAASLLAIGISLLFGNSVQVAKCAQQQVQMWKAQLDAVGSSEVVIEAQGSRSEGPSEVHLKWVSGVGCANKGLRLTILLPGHRYQLLAPTKNRKISSAPRLGLTMDSCGAMA